MMLVESSGPGIGEANMKADIRSAMDCLAGRGEPHLRFYSWNPAAISIGAHQTRDLVNDALARLHGVDVVTRPTGGGAILHTDEVTYCITLPLSDQTPTKAYAKITSALLTGLRNLGIQADAEPGLPQASPDGQYVHQAVCFSGIARNEIRVGGRKLVGSAQRLYRSRSGDYVLLQHGSILRSDAHTLLPIYLRNLKRHEAEESVRDLKQRSTSLDALLGFRPGFADVVGGLRQGFEEMSAWSRSHVVHEQRQEVNA